MTFEEHQELHRAMWTWMANHPGSFKLDWPGWISFHDKYHELALNCCFACNFTRQFNKNYPKETYRTECTVCPIDWNGISADEIHTTSYHCESPSREIVTEYDQYRDMLFRPDIYTVDSRRWFETCMTIANKEWHGRS